MQQMGVGPFAPDEILENQAPEESNGSDPATDSPQMHIIEMEPLGIPVIMGSSVQTSLKIQIKIGFKIDAQTATPSELDEIEETQNQITKFERYIPKLQDAFFVDLITYIPRLYRKYAKLDAKLVANRLKTIGQRTIGEGKILSLEVKTSEAQAPSKE